jgi:hypothetical protein
VPAHRGKPGESAVGTFHTLIADSPDEIVASMMIAVSSATGLDANE